MLLLVEYGYEERFRGDELEACTNSSATPPRTFDVRHRIGELANGA